MAIDAIEASSPLSPSPSPSHSSQQRHFYVAIDRPQFKMETLVDLLKLASLRPCLPIAVCCSSRDELDAVCSAVCNIPSIYLASLYSDLAEAERALILENFRQATIRYQNVIAESGKDTEIRKGGDKSHMVAVTDACLPFLSSGESSISARVLINYELPTKKETYMRRMATCLGADGIMINMVVGGEVVTLKSLEESSGLTVAEMPMHISEIL